MWEATANATAYWFYWFYHNAPAATTWDARFLFWFEGLCCSLAGLLPLPATIRAAFAQLLGEEIFAAKHGGAMVQEAYGNQPRAETLKRWCLDLSLRQVDPVMGGAGALHSLHCAPQHPELRPPKRPKGLPTQTPEAAQ